MDLRPEVSPKDPKSSELCPGQERQPNNGTLCWKLLFVWKQIVTLLEEIRLQVVRSVQNVGSFKLAA